MNIYKQFLSKLYRATRAKRLSWASDGPGNFVSTGSGRVVIREIAPLVAGPTETIGPQGFEVLAGDVIFTAWSGSETCDLIRGILAAGFQDWADHQDLMAKRLKEV